MDLKSIFSSRYLAFRVQLIFICAFLLLQFSCKESPPEPNGSARVQLSLTDVSCTEAWLRISTGRPVESIVLLREGQEVLATDLAGMDTVVVDTNLEPRHTYSYQVLTRAAVAFPLASNQIQVTTLDTTSHEFSWDPLVLLGEGGGNALYDIAIVNDTLVYAVGEIYKRDSLGNWDPLPYNLIKWDGRQWQLERVAVLYRGSLVTAPLHGIFATSASDIWLSSGVPILGDGQNWTQYHLFDMGVLTQNDGSVNKIYGVPHDVYFVGNRGTIAMYADGYWQKLPTGTTGTIQDVWGGIEAQTGQRVVLCAVSEAYSMGGQRILRISSNNVVDTIAWVPGRRPHSVWFQNTARIFACGDGVFMRDPSKRWHEIAGADVLPTFTERVRGQSPQDIFVVGDFGKIAHFNGVNFHVYPEVPGALFYSCDYKNNQMIAVGESNGRGIIVRMWR